MRTDKSCNICHEEFNDDWECSTLCVHDGCLIRLTSEITRQTEINGIAKDELDRCDKELRAIQKLNNDLLYKNNKMREHLKHALTFIPTADGIGGNSSPWYQLRETIETALKQG